MILWGFLTKRRSRGPCKTLARQVFGVTSDLTVGSVLVDARDVGESTSPASTSAEGAMVAFLFIAEEGLGTGEICGGKL